MAYTLQSLITILERILNPEQKHWILDHNQPQLQSLLQKAISLQQILDKSSLPKIGSLEIQIREAAHKTEDIIESRWVDEMLSIPEGANHTLITPDLQQVTRQLDSIMEQAVKLMEVEGKKKKIPSGSSSSTTPRSASFSSIVVGIDEDLMQLKDRLTGMQSKLEIVPIVGMGGIGKTTVARKLYQDPSIISHFRYARAWATISQDYDMLAILSSLLRCIIGKEFDDKHSGKGSDGLRDVLYQSLYGRRYMIVLDDIWNVKFWDEIRMYLPDNNNGSRILLTSRESGVAKHADSRSLQHQVQLLSQPQSWNLLSQIVFGEEEDCPNELQGIGEKIASDCGGLPLAINVIGGVLSKLERSVDGWEKIAMDVSVAIFGEAEEQFSNILSLSYDHLPNHLKPCFLYMAAFPEDHEIKAFNLILMWVAEGFLRSSGDTGLEEEAEFCINALVERNLVTVRRRTKLGKPSRYVMHDLLRDVSIRKADEEKFLQILNKTAPPHIASSSIVRRVSVQASEVLEDEGYTSAESMPLARSFLSTHDKELYEYDNPSPVFFSSRLLRVLDVIKISFSAFPGEILQLVSLRYLAICCTELPNGISKLCNLQTLIALLLFSGDAPSDIWEMSELRHIWLKNRALCVHDDYAQRFVQKKLLTISTVRLTPSLIERGFLENIPNVTDLGIYFDQAWANSDISRLHRVETFRCLSIFRETGYCPVAGLKFPCNIRDLSLTNCAVNPRMLTAVRALLHLEVLRIARCGFRNEEGRDVDEWEAAVEGEEFVSLRVLQLKDLSLVSWRADETNFPRLCHLFMLDCRSLKEIPSSFGEITTLEMIEIENCRASVVESARQIQEVKQVEFDDYSLQLHIIED